jgi:hypothetical protein
VPGGTALDLTTTALPMALDDLALVVGQLTGVGVRVALHGRMAGCDADGRRYGAAVTDGRRVVDPRTGRPADVCWATVQVVAGSARAATALALAAVLHGDEAPRWLAGRMQGERLPGRLVAVAARLVALDAEVVLVGDPAVLGSGVLDDGLLDGRVLDGRVLDGGPRDGSLDDRRLPGQRPLRDGPPPGVLDRNAAPTAVHASATTAQVA